MGITLFTDFAASDLYVGQVHAVLRREAPGVPLVDLLHEAPAFDVEAGAHLLAALAPGLAPGEVIFAVVDPGVGGPRPAAVVNADGRWYVGPDNGLLSIVVARTHDIRVWHITWRPERLSASFHRRDLFAPIAAAIARGDFPSDKLEQRPRLDVTLPLEARRIIYVDHYGNCMSGVPAAALRPEATIEIGAVPIRYARTFSEAEPGRPFWYPNSIGLVEIALNQGNAARVLNLRVGSTLRVY
jgi:S-adenosylmethionine hydrolase